MTDLPSCPECHAEYTYEDRSLFICPSCGHEWTQDTHKQNTEPQTKSFTDAHGNTLEDGDTITLIKDLKINGSSEVIKVGTKVKGIRLIQSNNGHDIDCKIPGFGAMQLKSEFVKKAK